LTTATNCHGGSFLQQHPRDCSAYSARSPGDKGH
jgi:hypothetical protein